MRFQTDDIDHFEAHLTSAMQRRYVMCPYQEGAFSAVIDIKSIIGIHLGEAYFANGLIIDKGPSNNDLMIFCQKSGITEFHTSNRVLEAEPDRSLIFNTKNCDRGIYRDNNRHRFFMIPMVETERTIERMFGRQVSDHLEINANFHPASEFGKGLIRILTAFDRLSQADMTSGPMIFVARSLRDAAIGTILEGLPHSLSHWFEAALAEPAPWQIRQAVEIIEARVDGSLTVQDLADRVGIGVRALQLGFRRHKQASPHAFMKRAALEAARRDLQAGAVPIGEIARRWGFLNSGRFAAAYRTAFHEDPSETRRRV